MSKAISVICTVPMAYAAQVPLPAKAKTSGIVSTGEVTGAMAATDWAKVSQGVRMLWRKPYSIWPAVGAAMVSGGSGASPEELVQIPKICARRSGRAWGTMFLVCGELQGRVKLFMRGHQVAVQLAEQALGLYDLPRNSSVHLVSVSENEIYRVEAPSGRRWALRLQRVGYQSAKSLASEIDWLVALRRDGVVATPVPVAGRNGEWIQSVAELRNVVAFEWENGYSPEIQMDLRQCFRKLGAITAQMHVHSRTWQRPEGFERFTWDFEAALGDPSRWGRWRDGLGMTHARLDLFGRTAELIRERLARYGSGPDRFGLAHCDLRLANLLLSEGEVKVIDFDDCGFGWYMYDAATPLSFYEHLPQAPALIDQWLEGYRTVSPVSQAEEEEIPTFLMLRRLLLVAWIRSHAETALAQSLGAGYTEQTVPLCSAYLRRFG
jgi:Ser/Thr protein kinase RdoA (MazF antagonist)